MKNDQPGVVAKRETTGLQETETFSTEIAPQGFAAVRAAEIQAAIVVAKRFPRNEEQCFEKIQKSCANPLFAEDVTYAYPRGKNKDGSPNIVSGESVYFAREFARIWTNLQYGTLIIRDEPTKRCIRSYSWDAENNNRIESDVEFEKVVQRKTGSGRTEWVPVNERDLRELTNRHKAINERNVILSQFPSHMKAECVRIAEETIIKNTKMDTASIRKCLQGFADINITQADIEKYLKCPVDRMVQEQFVRLRGIWKAIKDGAAVWTDYTDEEKKEPMTCIRCGNALDMNDPAGFASTPEGPMHRQDIRPCIEKQPAPAETATPTGPTETTGNNKPVEKIKPTGPKVKPLVAGRLKSIADKTGWAEAEILKALDERYGIKSFAEVTVGIVSEVEKLCEGRTGQ